MSKRLFVVLVILMSLSLIGIIFVQGYWIASAVNEKQESFSLNANQILTNVSESAQQSEYFRYYSQFQKLIDSIEEPENSQLVNIFQITSRNEKNNETSIYTRGILEEDYSIFPTFIDNISEDDSTSIKNYTRFQTRTIYKEELPDGVAPSNHSFRRATGVSTPFAVKKYPAETGSLNR